MRILVTGGCGYVGSITARYLLERGHDVVVLDSLVRGHASFAPSGARLVVGDVGDRASAEEATDGCAAVVHCAGYTDVAESVREPELYVANNVTAPTTLLEACARAGVRAFVFSSSAAVYGAPEESPITEEAPTRPINPYGASKLTFEHTLARFAAENRMRALSLRYFNVGGAWPDGSAGESHDPETHVIPRVLAAIRSGAEVEIFGDDYPTFDGTCVRDYVHVLDLAAAHLRGVESLLVGGDDGALNLGGGTGRSVRQVVAACEKAMQTDARITLKPRRPGDPPSLVAACDRARESLGWVPQRSDLATIVADAVRWHERAEGLRVPGAEA